MQSLDCIGKIILCSLSLSSLWSLYEKNYTGTQTTREQREIVEYLLREFESIHKWDVNYKGKILIQRKYKEREIIL